MATDQDPKGPQNSVPDAITAAAQAIGSTLGKLAVRTGIAKPPKPARASNTKKAAAKKPPAKKASPRRQAKAKKKTAPKRTPKKATLAKRTKARK